MSRFIAIPVGQGDAFFLEREGFSALIDGGRSRSGFSSMFLASTKTDGVDVAICTHNDADHANGILAFLEDGLRCGELWLPGRWLSALPDVLRPFIEVFEELTNDIKEEDGSLNGHWEENTPSSIDTYCERVDSTDTPVIDAGDLVADPQWPEPIVQMLEHAEPWHEHQRWSWPWSLDDRDFWRLNQYRSLSSEGVQLLWSAIEAASRIREIATQAFHRGIPVRWFEFDTVTPKGSHPVLQPINAREIARARSRTGSFLISLALTVANRESLVFWSPQTKHEPGVLFTADSDLEGMSLPSELNKSIVTAPHHGSESNSSAYRAVSRSQNGSSSIIWVRSDGRYRSRPGNTYMNLGNRRFCTLCRQPCGGSTLKQAVRFFSRGGVWIPHPASVECSCQ
jgi:hypothetical protein